MTDPEIPSSSDARLLRALREARLKLEEAERRRAEPIALVGLACRFPGGADSPEAFWRLLSEGRDAVRDLPSDRDRDVGGAWRGAPAHLRRGGFLEEVDAFDPRLFGIAPAEATGLDPQQRLLLEASWEALEDAGLDPRVLRGSAAGVWIGLSNADYHRTQLRAGEAGLDAYTLTGSALSLAAGRLSYLYGLRGPAMVVDTACSSSLVALHLAVASLRAGECDLALVGGVQLILEPDLALGLDRMAALSPRGLCRTFDAGADGFVRGEGGAMVVLRRLSDAERRGDPVRAVILASAVNQDGASSGLTAPNGTAQRELMRAALADARLSPEDVDYVEAHGTGTALGDPIELASLADVFGGRERPLAVGSVKTNLGHLEAAAGLAGLIKVALALEHGEIPPHLHLERPTPHFDWQGSPLEVTVRPLPWAPGERPRRAGISSFGFSGTNAHVVVAEAPARVAGPATATVRPEILPLSARSEAALDGLRRRWVGWLDGRGEEELAAACHTARVGRAHLEHRRAWIGESPAELAAALGAEGIAPLPGLDAGPSPGVVWLFTGQGSQYPGMARGLYAAFPAFRQELDLCGQILEPYLREAGAPGLTSLLFESSASDLARTGVSQPAIVAVELALARLWQSWGIAPAAVLAHSVGELAAACVAGVLSREDALALVAARARALQELPEGGGMASVLADEETVSEHLRPYGGRLVVAAVNGPRAVSVAGPVEDLDDLAARLGAAGLKVRRLEVSHAFHSPLVARAVERLRPVAEGLRYGEPQVPVISPVAGRLAVAGEVSRPGYWLDQILRPVRFADALAAADALGHRLYLEVGPAAVLVGMGMETLPGDTRLWVPSLRQGKDDVRQVLEALGRLYVHGAEVDWAGFDGGRELRKIRVPTYAFDRQRYWRDGREGVPAAAATEPAPVAPAAPVAPVQDPKEAVLARLLEMLAGVGGPAAEELDVHENLFRLGLDSIMLIQARQLIAREMGVDVELNRFFDETSTLGRLADYILAHAAPERLPGALPAAPAVPPVLPLAGGEPTLAGIAAQIQALGQQLQHLAAAPSAAKPARLKVARPAPDRPSVLPNRPGRSRSSSAEMAERQRRHLEVLVPRYEAKTGASKSLAARHRPYLASSRHLAGFRPEWKELVYQIAGGRGEGARIWDADGREYRDFTMGFGVALFGHGPDFVREAVAREVERGMVLGPLSDRAGETARRLCDLTGVERAAFFNTGTEAVMCALRIARTVTGRSKVALFEGSYHGMFDGVLALGTEDGAVPVSPGTTPGMVEDLIVLPYGDPAALETVERHAGDLAAVLVEPVQSRHPDLQPRDFLLELRALTARRDVALILDEMITGFRCHPAGVQGRWGVRADLVTYGKILGGGMPVGAVAGAARFLDAVDGGVWAFGDDSIPRAASTFTSGTFCNHPLTMAAGGAVLARLQEAGPGLQQELDARTERLCRRLDALFQAEGLPLRMAWFSSLFRFVFEADLELLFFHLLDRGFYVWEGRNCFLSAAHTDADVDALVDAVDDSLREIRAAGLVPEKTRAAAVAGHRAAADVRVLPASPAQKRLFILDQLGGADVAYHLHEARIVHGRLDAERLRAALAGVMAAHESLRTGFGLVDGEPAQRIHGALEPAFEVLDRPDEDPAALVAELLRPFDLERPPLLRLSAVRLGPDRHLFLIDVHHIVCDGSSLTLLVAELLARYRGETPPAPERQYRHFAEWHHALLASPEARRQEDYWRALFDREAPVLDLPADFARPAALDFAGGAARAEIGEEGTRRLKALARSGGATLYAVLLAVYQTLLYRLTGQRDLVIGAPVSGRPGAEYDRVIGMFVATLPLRLPLDPEAPFLDHLASTARALLTAFDHADYPFERLVEKLALPRDPGRNPLFDTMFEFEVAEDGALEVPGLRFETLGIEDGTTMFDLDVETALAGDRIRLVFKHRSRLLRRETAERFLRCYLNLLDGAATEPRQPLAALPLLDAAERRALLVDWNDTAVPFPDVGLHELFEEQARRAPDRIALIDELEGRERVLTYRELDAAAGRLAGRLRGLGIGPERFVGIFMERSLELIVAFLGVLKAGGAYVPLDPEYPAQRIDLLTEDLGRPLVLAQSYLLERLPATLAPDRVLAVDFEWRWLRDGGPLADTAVDPLQPAYALFTSGSTGRPKSVVVPHRSIVNHTLWYVRDLGVTAADVFLQKTVFTFDTSLTEIYAPLATGCRLVLPRPREHADPAYVVSLIRRYGVTILEDVPSFTELLADEPGFEECRTLRWHNPGGEALTAALTRRILERLDVRMANMYGPTEAAVDSIYKVTDRASLREIGGPAVPIGRPVSNMAAYVVDARMEPVPVGVAGELLLGGRSLGRGYYGRPDLTADRFIPDPLSGASGARLYRTGDLARWSPSRDVLFLGRLDHQVKIRGLRVELGEIEAVLAAHEPVEAALVVHRPGARGGAQLVAYVVPRGEGDAGELRAWLKERLPSYMVPSAFVFLAALPLTTSGKVDRKALPEPDETAAAEDKAKENGGPRRPRTPAEEIVAAVFAELLGVPEVGLDEDFFALGGHSLLATQAVSRLRAAFGAALPLRALFEAPTVEDLARVAGSLAAGAADELPTIGSAPEAASYPLSSAQRAVWLACQMQDDTTAYNMAEAYRIDGDLDADALERSLTAVVARHEILRTVFVVEAGEPRQRVLPAAPALLERHDLSAEADPEAAALALCREAAAAPFDLAAGPLFRAALFVLGPRRHALLFNLHHIVFDAWSTRVLIEEVLALYAGRPLPAPRRQYRDYAVWQTGLLDGGALAGARSYWHRQLTPPAPPLELPTDRPRPRWRTLAGGQVHRTLDPALTGELRRLGRAAGATLFMTLHAAVKVLLHALTGQRDLAVGTLWAGRFDEALEDQVGFYLNTLVLRDRLDPDEGFLGLLGRVRRTTLEGFEHGHYPYDRLVSELQGRRDPGRQPLFDVLVNQMDPDLTGAGLESAGWEGFQVAPLRLGGQDAKFDLTWYLFEHGDSVEVTLEYSADLFDAPAVQRLADRFLRLLLWAARHPEAPLAELELGDPAPLPPVLATPSTGLEPLSPHQERLWFIDRFERGNVYAESPTYHNVPLLVRFAGEPDRTLLERALGDLAARHEALRTRLVTRDDRGWQAVEPPAPVRLRVLADEPDAGAAVLRETLRPFDLAEEVPARAVWLSSPGEDGRLLLVLHHALADWATLDLLMRDLAELYAARAEGRPHRLPEPVPQARDFARWQSTLPAEALETHLLYWRRELGGELKALELPTDRPRPAIHTYTAARHFFRLPGAAVQGLARQCGQDSEAALLAAFETVLHRWAGHGEIVIGTAHPGREIEGTADLAGPVANLLVLRSSLAGDPPLGAVAAALGRTLARARRHAALPFDRLVLALRPDKDMSRTALFDVLFRVAPPPVEAALPGGLVARREDLHLGWGKYDLYLCLTPGEGEWEGGLVYNADLFDAGTAGRLAGHLATLIEGAAASGGVDSDTPVSRLPLLRAAERAELIAASRPRRAFAGDEPLHRRFRRRVQAAPAAPAVAAGGEILSYSELARRADRLAAELRRRGVGSESRVGVCAGRSAALIEAILAVLEAGGAYVPLDPGYPREHLAWTLADSGTRWLIADAESLATARSLAASCPEVEVLEVEALRAGVAGPSAVPQAAPHPDQAAYVIYTSGSTGRPKGCVVTHRNAARLFDATDELFGFGPADTVPLFHSYAFDFSVWEIWAALACGGRLVVVPDVVRKDPAVFAGLLVTEGVTVLNQTPSAFHPLAEQLAQTGAGRLRLVLFGGEALDFARLRPFFARFGDTGPRLFNLYGITETTVHVTAREVTAADVDGRAGSRIGAPLPDLDLQVLDPWGEPLPEGLTGELWVGGAGLARGYLGQPGLTADRFRPHPFSDTPGARLYRSGDLARRTADRDVEYLGRADHQIKVRGFRIEPGEIEAALVTFPGVRGALVMARDSVPGGPGDRRLVAYVESAELAPAGELRRHLLDRLPPHMVPAAFVRVDRFPLTANGKVDRDALPLPDRRGAGDGEEAVAPRNPVESVLADIWREVLGLERVGVHDDFFALGGDSILSIQILSRAARAGLELTTQAIFQYPTVAGLAAVARPRTPVLAEQGPVTGEILPTPIQAWFFEQELPRPDHFNQSILLSVRGADPGRLERALEALAVHHDALRLRARAGSAGWRLDLLAPEEARLALERVDLAGLPPERRREALQARAAAVQASLDLASGRPAAAVLFHLGGDADRLLLAVHHLAVDGVSWRILLEDLDAAYRGLPLPAKTTSVREWARRLHERAASPEISGEVAAWLELASRPAGPAAFRGEEGDAVASEASVAVHLPAAATAQLLGDALRAYGNRAEDFLLAGLVAVLGEERGLRLDLEGHGRVPLPEAGGEALDLGRTVGWLTTLYPVWLEAAAEPGALLKSVKERLRGVPSEGLGYGLLRHLRREPRLAALPPSAVLFNFHGRVDMAFPPGSPFGPAAEDAGPQQDPAARRSHALEITGAVTHGALELTWTYSSDRHRREEIADLAARHLAAVEALVRHALDPAAGGYTPSDFPEAGFSQEELEDFLSGIQQPD